MIERIPLRMDIASKVTSCGIDKERKVQRDRNSERKKRGLKIKDSLRSINKWTG